MPWRYYTDDGVDEAIEVIVEPDYRGDLQALAKTRVVWIVDTPQNRSAIDASWEIGAEANLCEINRFTEPKPDCEENLIDIVGMLDTHYHPFPSFIVHGAPPSASLPEALANWGFKVAEMTPDGFIARSIEEVPETTLRLGRPINL
jgi:hypothetical protein